MPLLIAVWLAALVYLSITDGIIGTIARWVLSISVAIIAVFLAVVLFLEFILPMAVFLLVCTGFCWLLYRKHKKKKLIQAQ
jgi:ABC-type antimicrobial peptide transport system permease subunit